MIHCPCNETEKMQLASQLPGTCAGHAAEADWGVVKRGLLGTLTDAKSEWHHGAQGEEDFHAKSLNSRVI